MNPKGEEGEFYMKKSLLVLASIMILALCIFVACTSEVSDPYDGLTYVTFGGESPTSKNLLASYEVASYDSLYWFYTAEKKDNYGTSGAVENKPVHEGNTGLNNTVGPFSQGKWLFTLCAYKNNDVNGDAKVYESSVEVSLKGQNVTVPVSVIPCGGTGALEFRGVYFSWKDNAASSPAIPVITIVAEGTTTGQKYTLSNSFTAPEGVGTNDVKIPLVVKDKNPDGKFYIDDNQAKFPSVVADFYNCSIIAHIKIEGSQTPIFSQQLGFRVYGSTTTTISGDITEGELTGVNFSIDNMAVIEMPGSSKASFSVTPSGMDGKTTDVDFSKAGLTGKHVLVVDVNSAVAASNFTIEGVDSASRSIVAGIGLELSSVNEAIQTPVTSFGNNGKVVVTTYIAKGLSNVTVKYNGINGGDPTIWDYDSSSGKLTFTTTHFSEFYVVADKVEAINLDTNVAYKSFVEAVNAIVKEGSVSLLSDVSLGALGNTNEKIYIGSESEDQKSISIDLCGHDINLFDSSLAFINVKVEFLGKGTIRRTGNTGNSAIWLYGSNENVSDYTVLTIGKEVLIDAAYGVSVDKNPNASKNKEDADYGRSCGVVVNLCGNINATYCGLYVNGTCESLDNAPVFNLDGVTIACDGTTNAFGELCGIYAAGYAIWNIKGGTTITAPDTAIEIRAGKMTIDGGTFTANATKYSCTANGNGATTVGASIAVAQHTTKLPIDVVITGTPKLSGVYDLSVTNPQGNTKDAISNVKVTINENVEKIYVSTDFIRERNVIRAKTTEEDSESVACLSDGRNFTTLQAAVDAVKNTGYITLLEGTSVVEKGEHRVKGDGISIDDNRGLNLTIDFGGLTYFVNGYRVGSNSTEAFHLGKGNTIVLKNGAIKSTTGSTKVLIKNYSNLMLEDIALSCQKDTQSVLSCVYGTTHITGNTSIVGSSYKRAQKNALEVYLCLSDYKEGVEVVFDDAFKGMVSGYVLFTTEENVSFDGTKYKHSLSIETQNLEGFKDAKFGFLGVGLNSCFRTKTTEGLTVNASNTYTYPLSASQSADGYYYLADSVIVNKTTDRRYTDIYIAIQNSPSNFESKLVLQNNCEYKTSMNFSLAKKLSIDLNGKELRIADASQVIKFANSGVLTIENGCDDGSIVFPSGMTFESFFSGASKGQLVINGGTFNSDPTLYVNTETHDISPDTNTGTWTVTAKN